MDDRVRNVIGVSAICVFSMVGLVACLGDSKSATSTTPTTTRSSIVPTVPSTSDASTTLLLPTSTTSTTAVAQTYTVVAGDSIGKIAAKVGVSAQSIIDANGLSDPNKILVGQKLRIPTGGDTPTTAVANSVKSSTTRATTVTTKASTTTIKK